MTPQKPPTTQEFKDAVRTLHFFLKHADSLFHFYHLLELNLFKGVEGASEQFIKRMAEEHPVEKRNLAQAAIKYHSGRLAPATDAAHDVERCPRCFYESGSVVAHIVGALAHELAKNGLGAGQRPNFSALTNNLAALTALAGLVEDVRCIKGRFDPKYFALLPFREQEADSPSIDETHAFYAVRSAVAECDLAFTACSSFSLIYGPLVGTRANALTKRAIFDAISRWPTDTQIKRKAVLAFQVQKLVPLAKKADNSKFDIRKHRPDCYGVFAPPDEAMRAKMYESWKQLFFQKNEGHDGLPKHLKWHEDHLSGEKQLTSALESLKTAYQHKDAHNDPPILTNTWLHVASKVELLIGLPDDCQTSLERTILDEEIHFANAILNSGGSPYRYRATYQTNVASVRLEDAGSPRPARRSSHTV